MATRILQFVAWLISLIAVLSFGIAIADIILTSARLCGNGVSCPDFNTEKYRYLAMIFSWIASGVWASIAAFTVGVLAMQFPKDQTKKFALLATVAFLTAVVILPAMIVLNVLEAYWVAVSNVYNLYTQTGDVAKFILPLIIAILGLVEFFMVAGVLLTVCIKPRYKIPATADNRVEHQQEQQQQPVAPQLPAPVRKSDDPYAGLGPIPASGYPGLGYYYPSRIYQLQPAVRYAPAVRPVPLSYVPMSSPSPAAALYGNYGEYMAGGPMRTYGARYVA